MPLPHHYWLNQDILELVYEPADVDVLRNISAGECQNKGGHLLAMETVEEQTFILVTFSSVICK